MMTQKKTLMSFVLVVYYYETNHLKYRGLKQQWFIISRHLWVD